MGQLVKQVCLNKENKVVMHNDLLKGTSDLSINEVKLLRIIIMQIVREDTDFETFTMTIGELGEMLELSTSNLYRDIDTMTTNLMRELVIIRGEKQKYKKFQWCSLCEYEAGLITIKLHDQLKPYLLGLSSYYTQYTLENVLLLKKIYAIRLYELIEEGLRKKVYGTKEASVYISIEDLRKATGTEKKYPKMGMFYKRVIEESIEEIHSKLWWHYHIDIETKKEKRKTIGYTFHIKSNNR